MVFFTSLAVEIVYVTFLSVELVVSALTLISDSTSWSASWIAFLFSASIFLVSWFKSLESTFTSFPV